MNPLPIELTAAEPAVTTHELVKDYDGRRVLDRVGLTVPQGAFYTLVGANGAGKTTTFKILLDLVRTTSGSAQVFGFDCRFASARSLIGYVAESPEVGYGWMRVGRLIEHHALYHPRWDARYANRLCDELEIDRRLGFGALSKGQARRVQLLLALAHHPPLLLLDEPTDGLDPLARDRFLAVLASHLAESPTEPAVHRAPPTVLLATHHTHLFERFADHLGALRRGRLIAQVERERLRRQLLHYRARVPDDWTPPDLTYPVLDQTNGDCLGGRQEERVKGREISWTVWGKREEIVARLESAGAAVRSVESLDLERATLAILELEHETASTSWGGCR